MNAPRVVVIGATGAVGKVVLQVLEERTFPMSSLRLCASPRSVGKTIEFKGEEITVEVVDERLLAECDIAFISATDEMSRQMGELAPKQGCIVIDDSSVWRMDPRVPLVVPEVNGDDLDQHEGVISIPNCSTTPLVMTLWPLHRQNPVRRVVVATYQSVSGTGAAAMAELSEQSREVLAGKPAVPKQYPHQIALNLIPHIGSLGEDGYYSEEVKMRQETQKIMHEPDVAFAATCVRVPVQVSHSEAVFVEFQRPMTPEEARDILTGAPGISVVDDPSNAVYPMPIDAAGHDEVFIGRIRRDTSHPNGLAMWIVSDNLRKGAATNAVQIAEELVHRGMLLRQRL
ncbi:aspartate-semialdehyde dehydrogenase [Patescibacteria group bacterium]|nr:aspartate-semialdehyde dehydrogenase [Patescibacteria group bacterium]